jgi:hypothetical protein
MILAKRKTPSQGLAPKMLPKRNRRNFQLAILQLIYCGYIIAQ